MSNVININDYISRKEQEAVEETHEDLKNIFYQITGQKLKPDLKINETKIEELYTKEEHVLEAIKFLEFAQFHLFNINHQESADLLNNIIEDLYEKINLGFVNE